MKSPVAIVLFSTLLLFLFAYTASSKLMNLERFRATLSGVPFTGMGAGVLAVAVPMAELVIVLLLLFPATRLKGLWGAAVLLTLFTVYLGCMLLFAPHLPCSCGGVISGLSWEGHVGMNVGLMGATVMAIRGCRKMSDE